MPAPPGPPSRSGAAKVAQLLGLWGLALAMSAALVAAGQRSPEPLPVRGDQVLVLLLAPALAVVAWLFGRWRLDGPALEPALHPEANLRKGESSGSEQESV
jgi:hypothetical protein